MSASVDTPGRDVGLGLRDGEKLHWYVTTASKTASDRFLTQAVVWQDADRETVRRGTVLGLMQPRRSPASHGR